MHSIKKRPISSIHQDASKKRIIVEEITTQFNNQNSTNVVMNSVNSHESVLNQLNDEELKDVQLIQELLLNEGMDDDLDSTPDVDINYQAIQTNLEQNNLKNQLINDPSEDEFDQMDLDEETMNQMDLQASQYMGDDKIPQNIISMPIVTNQVSYQHLDRFSTQNAPLSMSSNRPLHTLPQGNVRKSHLLSKPTIQSVLGQNPNIQRLQDQLEKIQTELERTKTVNKQLENELLQRTGEVTYARNKLYQINDINVELRNNLATQKIQSQLESVDIKTQLEAEIDRLKTDLNFKGQEILSLQAARRRNTTVIPPPTLSHQYPTPKHDSKNAKKTQFPNYDTFQDKLPTKKVTVGINTEPIQSGSLPFESELDFKINLESNITILYQLISSPRTNPMVGLVLNDKEKTLLHRYHYEYLQVALVMPDLPPEELLPSIRMMLVQSLESLSCIKYLLRLLNQLIILSQSVIEALVNDLEIMINLEKVYLQFHLDIQIMPLLVQIYLPIIALPSFNIMGLKYLINPTFFQLIDSNFRDQVPVVIKLIDLMLHNDLMIAEIEQVITLEKFFNKLFEQLTDTTSHANLMTLQLISNHMPNYKHYIQNQSNIGKVIKILYKVTNQELDNQNQRLILHLSIWIIHQIYSNSDSNTPPFDIRNYTNLITSLVRLSRRTEYPSIKELATNLLDLF